MKELVINEGAIENHFLSLAEKWDREPYLSLIIDISTERLYSVATKLLNVLPNDLAFAILADLVERDEFPLELLSEVYSKGDKACKMSICLRKNLCTKIAELCASSDDLDILEHFEQRYRSGEN